MQKISVIVPIFNTLKELLNKCIDTIIRQTYKNIEILLIDDGSEMKIAKYCDELTKKDERVCCIHKKNEGVSIARNIGLENATGDWIMFVDSDDWLEEDAIEKLLKKSEEFDIIISKHFFNNMKREKKINEEEIIILNEKYAMRFFLTGFLSSQVESVVWGNLYKKDFLYRNNIKFEKGVNIGEDFIFNMEAFLKAKKIKFVSDYTYHYRTDNQESVTAKFDDKMLEKYMVFLDRIENNFGALLKNEFNSIYQKFIYSQLIYLFKINIFNTRNLESFWQKNERMKNIIKEKNFSQMINEIETKDMSIWNRISITLLRMKLCSLYILLYHIRIKKLEYKEIIKERMKNESKFENKKFSH